MSKYLVAIDPVLLLSEKQLDKISKDKRTLTSTGQVGDVVKDMLQKDYEFADVFQSTDEKHSVKMHEFLLADKTGERKMHDAGELETPTGLVAYVAVDEEWIKNHPEQAAASAHVKLDPRIDVTKFKANDGATEDSKTTGFIRYGDSKTPVMAMLPAGDLDYRHETISEMEKRADEREGDLRNRQSTFQQVSSAFQQAKRGSMLDAFMVGWNLADQLGGKPQTFNVDTNKKPRTPVEKSTPNQPQDMTTSLNELSMLEMMREQQSELGR